MRLICNRTQNDAIWELIALFLTNQIAGNTIDFKMNVIKIVTVRLRSYLRFTCIFELSTDHYHDIRRQFVHILCDSCPYLFLMFVLFFIGQLLPQKLPIYVELCQFCCLEHLVIDK